MVQKCQFDGCKKDAEYEIELIDDPPHGYIICVCSDHFPRPGILDPIDKVKKIPPETELMQTDSAQEEDSR